MVLCVCVSALFSSHHQVFKPSEQNIIATVKKKKRMQTRTFEVIINFIFIWSCLLGVHRFFRKSCGHFKILVARRVT